MRKKEKKKEFFSGKEGNAGRDKRAWEKNT